MRAASGKRSQMALASLMFGLLGILTLGLTSVVGLILGFVSLARQPEKRAGALLGIVVSALTLLFSLAITIPASDLGNSVVIGALETALAQSRTDTVKTELSIYAARAELYACEHDGRLPPPEDWVNAIDVSYEDSRIWRARSPQAYAMNVHLAGKTVDEINSPDRTVLFFERKTGPNVPLAGGPELLPETPPFEVAYLIAFVDGHVEYVGEYKARHFLVWDPRESQGSPVVLETRPLD